MQIVDFLRDYWQYISVGLVIVLDIVILIVKRLKVKVNLPASSVWELIDLIKDAEKKFGSGHGEEKLNYVLDEYAKLYGDLSISEVRAYIAFLIDQILDTPQRKEKK